MRNLSSAIIYDDKWKILVVDKPKENWKVITILPWWKIDNWETEEQALQRELSEELWILNIQIIKKIWDILWESPTLWIKSKINLFEIEIPNNSVFTTTAEVGNPRFLTKDEILELTTTTQLTKNCINKILKYNIWK